MMFSLTVGLLVLLIILALYIRYCHFGRLIAKIPGDKGWPIVGIGMETMLLNSGKGFQFIRKYNKKYREISKLSSFLIGVINISCPDYVEKLFSTARYNEKRTPYNFLQSWLSEGLLISNGDKWKQRRKLLTPAFHFSILRNYCRCFNEQTERFLEKVQLETDKDCTDVVPLITRTTLSVMCETAMGTSVKNDTESIVNKYFKALHVFGSIVVKRVFTPWLHVEWIHKRTPVGRMETKLVQDMHELTDQIVQGRKNQILNSDNKIPDISRKRLAFLDLLLENEKQGNIDMAGVREEVDTFLFEVATQVPFVSCPGLFTLGHDTTAMALCFMITRIANEEDVQNRIYEEMIGIFGKSDRLPTTEDLQEMTYLECCIKESLRLYPSVPLIARYVTEDIDLGKYTLPRGSHAFIHVFDLHRHPDVYPEPERFIPERFRPDQAAARHPYAYLAFSAGSRNCIGKKFAMLEMKTILSGLLRRFRLEPVTKPEDIVFDGDIVLRSRHPLYVRIRSRK